MQPVGLGRLLLSEWHEVVLQRRHCRTKDWPYSQAAITVRNLFCFESVVLQDGVIWESGGMCCVDGSFEVLEMNADAIPRKFRYFR